MESIAIIENDALAEALAEFDKSSSCPCVGCPNVPKCQKSDIACEAFYNYASCESHTWRGGNGTASRQPTKAIFKAIFRTKDGPSHQHPLGYRPRQTADQRWLAEGMLQQGHTIEETARSCHLGKTTVGKIKRELGL